MRLRLPFLILLASLWLGLNAEASFPKHLFAAIAQAPLGLSRTNTVTADLRATNSFAFDLNGNLLSEGKRGFDYDDENQLIRVTLTNSWKAEFV